LNVKGGAALLLLALGALTSTAAAAQQPGAFPVHIGGRVIPRGDGSLGFGWPGIYFESRFTGTAVRVRFLASAEQMRLLIDEQEKRLFDKPIDVDVTVGGLAPGDHVVRLEKLTESQTGGGYFYGFFPVEGSIPLPAPSRTRQIEFVGDSHTVGYGDMSPKRECSKTEVHDRTNSQRAFGPLVARHYDADYRLIAYSGYGIVRNYDGGDPGLNLPAIYPRLRPDEPNRIEPTDPAWRPQLVVIGLGNNDFSTPLHPGERWADQGALKADYRASYVRFVAMLHARQPQARFILIASNAFIEEVEEVARRLEPEMPGRVTTLRVDGLDLGGCDWHPSLADHEKTAKLIENAIDGMGTLWTD
jgi:hypothetical protein